MRKEGLPASFEVEIWWKDIFSYFALRCQGGEVFLHNVRGRPCRKVPQAVFGVFVFCEEAPKKKVG